MLDKKRWTPAESKARDHFAGLAMQDLLSKKQIDRFTLSIEIPAAERREIAKLAYQMADDMLQQRAHAFYDHEA